MKQLMTTHLFAMFCFVLLFYLSYVVFAYYISASHNMTCPHKIILPVHAQRAILLFLAAIFEHFRTLELSFYIKVNQTQTLGFVVFSP